METSTLDAIITAVATLLGAAGPVLISLMKTRRNGDAAPGGILVPEGYKVHRPKPKIQWRTVFLSALFAGLLGYLGARVSQIWISQGVEEVQANDLNTGPYMGDDFEDAEFENGYNDTAWLKNASGGCQIFQENGVMVFSNFPSDEYLKCALMVRTAEPIPFHELNSIQVKLKSPAENAHTGKVEQVIRISTVDLPSGEWWAACGLVLERGEAKAFLNVLLDEYSANGEQPEIFRTTNVDPDVWHILKLAVTENGSVQCHIDGYLVGELRSRYVSELSMSHFEIGLVGYRPPGAFGSTLADEFQIQLLP